MPELVVVDLVVVYVIANFLASPDAISPSYQ